MAMILPQEPAKLSQQGYEKKESGSQVRSLTDQLNDLHQCGMKQDTLIQDLQEICLKQEQSINELTMPLPGMSDSNSNY